MIDDKELDVVGEAIIGEAAWKNADPFNRAVARGMAWRAITALDAHRDKVAVSMGKPGWMNPSD